MRPLKGSALGFGSGAHSAKVSNLECQDQQCVEEECDPEECGDEKRPPREDNLVCGIDRRPLLPVLLASSTLTGALHMMVLQFPLLREFFDGAYIIRAFFLVLYAVTLACMAYCALCDPGQLKETTKAAAALMMSDKDGAAEDHPLPKRAHKTWLYKLPIRRYDHYCRWLTNCVGLLSHREFVVMCIGLVSIGVFGGMLDIFLVLLTARQGTAWVTGLFLMLHVTYSMMLTALAGPILRLHIGFICRNELANEWKRNDFYVVTSSKTGLPVPVNDLSDDEFNERFETFEYDKNRNIFDKGCVTNCFSFWCTPRWDPSQSGEF
jgi:hypothetical protein